jgi:mRNA-degrading endonuclease RelE of RelBE toxin-antitoxin system
MSNAAPWSVQLGRTAAKQLDRLPDHDAAAILAALRVLARDPFAHPKVQRLSEHGFDWRLRVRDYRVLYDLDPLTRSVLVGDVVRRTSTTYAKRRR